MDATSYISIPSNAQPCSPLCLSVLVAVHLQYDDHPCGCLNLTPCLVRVLRNSLRWSVMKVTKVTGIEDLLMMNLVGLPDFLGRFSTRVSVFSWGWFGIKVTFVARRARRNKFV